MKSIRLCIKGNEFGDLIVKILAGILAFEAASLGKIMEH